MMKCMKLPTNKESHLSIKKDVENVTAMTNIKTNKKNESSPHSCREYPVSNHNTPLRQKQNLNMEESTDLDDCTSPIIFPCTQEGYNEISWDWQTSLNVTPDSRNKKQNIQCETPKGTKLLQRKRNSNSPLLYKPLKRKTIKMENIENIGQFAAELQALNEKMIIMKQNSKDHLDDYISIINTSNDEETNLIVNNNNEYSTGNCDPHDTIRKSPSYDELFDDSIDDCMAKCTQEIEEKFNLVVVEGNCNTHSPTSIKKEESFNKDNITAENLPVQLHYKENPENISIKTSFHKGIHNSNTLRTYSKLFMKKGTNSDILATTCRDGNLHRSCLNNNDNKNYRIRKSCDNKKLSKNSATELFDIPDDSFDDCLATCVEDEKLVSRTTKADDVLTRGKNDTKFGVNHRRLTHAPLKGKLSCNDMVPEAQPTAKVEVSVSTTLENRKFFKTKSLSDQYISQDAITNTKNIAYITPTSYTTKSTSHINSLSKDLTSRKNVTHAFVSTNRIDTNNKIEESAISLMRSAGRTHASDVNRFAIRESGDRFVKYNSTGNIKSKITKEVTRIGSQPTRCTAEEIERKRQQAKMRLEARQKLYAIKNSNCNIR